MQNLAAIGFFVVLVGFALMVAGLFMQVKSDAKVALVGFIGPFPIGFGNDKKLLVVAAAMGLAFILIWLFFLHRQRYVFIG